jgi:hypothetical protein
LIDSNFENQFFYQGRSDAAFFRIRIGKKFRMSVSSHDLACNIHLQPAIEIDLRRHANGHAKQNLAGSLNILSHGS